MSSNLVRYRWMCWYNVLPLQSLKINKNSRNYDIYGGGNVEAEMDQHYVLYIADK